MPGHDRTSWAEHAGTELDRAGHRRGRARSAVIETLARESCALSAVEIEDGLRETRRPVSRASIYRTLDQLAMRGLVTKLELGGGHARYEIVDPRGDHHHHLLCESCGGLTPFDDPGLERAIGRVSKAVRGFRVADHEVVLH